MKTVMIEKYGSAEVLEIKEISIPEPGPDEVLVRIHAASLNPIDWKIRNGEFRWLINSHFPKKLGCDFSGVVEKLGSGVTQFKPGDEIFGITEGHRSKEGSYSEYILISKNLISAKPKNLSHLEAASLPVSALTVLYIFEKLLGGTENLRGKEILIHGGSGGVGTAAIQLAKHWGAQVTAVSSEGNLEYLRSLGADHVVSYSSANYLEAMKAQDIVLDVACLLEFHQVRSFLKNHGSFITLIPNLQRIRDSFLSLFRSRKVKICLMKPSSDGLQKTRELVERGILKPVIERVFPLEKIQEAHRISELGHARGKTAIEVLP